MLTFVSIQKLTFRNRLTLRNFHRSFAPVDLDDFPVICLNITVNETVSRILYTRTDSRVLSLCVI